MVSNGQRESDCWELGCNVLRTCEPGATAGYRAAGLPHRAAGLARTRNCERAAVNRASKAMGRRAESGTHGLLHSPSMQASDPGLRDHRMTCNGSADEHTCNPRLCKSPPLPHLVGHICAKSHHRHCLPSLATCLAVCDLPLHPPCLRFRSCAPTNTEKSASIWPHLLDLLRRIVREAELDDVHLDNAPGWGPGDQVMGMASLVLLLAALLKEECARLPPPCLTITARRII